MSMSEDSIMVDLESVVMETTINLLKLAATRLPSDVKNALVEAAKDETTEVAKKQLEAILANIDLAEKMGAPMCQDTGVQMFYLKAGSRFPILGKLSRILKEAVRRGTEAVPLRPNAVDPFTRENSGDNTGKCIPWIDWEVIEGEILELTALPKGFGAEMMSGFAMLTPSDGIKGLKRFVVDTLIKAGARPCPPVILGIGVGGGADGVMKLAREAVLRSLNRRNENPEIAKLEKELLRLVNETGIGPMGLGGKTTVLGVNIEYAHTHTAALPVGVIVQCWAARKASARIRPDGHVEYLT
jgi:fumarate hydratase subunit alpha